MTIATDVTLPDIDQLQIYLQVKGWRAQSPGPAGSLWVKEDARVGVPHDDDTVLIKGAVDRVAWSEGRKPDEVAQSARFVLYDITHLRALNDNKIADTIPLRAATKILSSAKRMLQATATTARWERAQIGGNYSRIGDEVVNRALMGHTERGSFVIPVLVALPEPSPVDIHDMMLPLETGSFHEAPPEPFERRVTRTFAQSMQALRDIVVSPAKEPSVDQIYELIYRGVSREFCIALNRILSEPSVSQFGATIEWAPAVSPPTSLTKQVSIDAEAADLINKVGNRMRQQKVDPNQVFSGTIIALRHEDPNDPFGEITVSTLRHGHLSEVHVRLSIDQYEKAWEWHFQGRAVLVEGIVRRVHGRPLRVDRPTRFHPVDEMQLSAE